MKFFHFILFVFLFSVKFGFTQSKHALVIGINDYYFTENVLSSQSLKGCVNDAKSVKEMIVTHFGYPNNNITELYNKQATQKRILDEMNALLKKCNAGDNAFIFYSGHGLLLNNSLSVGGSQAIVPSDIFQRYRSYILNQDLAVIFNKFVDKKVTLTVIFDCCYSWSMGYSITGDWETFEDEDAGERWMFYLEYDELTSNLTDTVYRYDTLSATYFPVVLDQNAPPKEQDSNYVNYFRFNAEDSSYSSLSTDTDLFERSIPGANEDIKTKKIIQEIPSKRVNSNFLFISATNGEQKGLEKTDLNKNKHGVFTRALIDVVNKNNSTTSSSNIFSQIKSKLKYQFIYSQTPSMVGERERMYRNLLGVEPSSLNNKTIATCTSVENNVIKLDIGALSGLAVGNVLKSRNNSLISIEITALKGENTSLAAIKNSGSRFSSFFFPVKPGDKFEVKDWHIQSSPLLKIYLPEDNSSFSQLNHIVQQTIQPIHATDNHFLPFEQDYYSCSKLYINGNKTYHIFERRVRTENLKNLSSSSILKMNPDEKYFIYLPVPTELSEAVKKLCEKDQNIELVDDPSNANITFYCAYSKATKAPIFVCSKETLGDYKKGISTTSHKLSTYTVSDKNKSTAYIASKIYNKMLLLASKKGMLNYYEKK